MKHLLACLFLVSSLSTTAAQAKLVEVNPASSTGYKVGILFKKSAEGRIEPVCEFPATGFAPQHLNVANGPSLLPDFDIGKCNAHQLEIVASTVKTISSGKTAALAAVIPAALCVTLAGTMAYVKAKDLPLNNTASFILGANAMAVTSSLGMGLSGFGGATLCALVGEGLGQSIQFLVGYFKEPL